MNIGLATLSEMPEPELFIALFFTGLLFIVGVSISSMAASSLRGKKPSKVKRVLTFIPLGCGTIIFAPFYLILLNWIVYWVSPKHQTTHAEVIRHYQGNLYGAKEEIELNTDDTFKETIELPNGRRYAQAGHWKLNGNYVEFSDYLLFYDYEHNKLQLEPTLYMGYQLYYLYGDKSLVDDWDSDHFILKGY